MGKKSNTKSKFAEAIDPRFTGLFKNSSSNENDSNHILENESDIQEGIQMFDQDLGFQDFLSKKLFEYLDRSIKEIEVEGPFQENHIIQHETGDISYLPTSDILSEVLPSTCVEPTIKPKKKKKKKKKK
ncbi:hypothetical protein CEXT_208421 [Caerostris extrusa]|uniref:Uncharacterized protein n=1 Tax=Caerostris extrusa TaxID=172846 RepID=A0AAV4MZA5_CAEEX|nr:hypothetical protein CEXT_208421 [Caerostris extrusa]